MPFGGNLAKVLTVSGPVPDPHGFVGLHKTRLSSTYATTIFTWLFALFRSLTSFLEQYTSVQRSQHLTQADPRVFGQSYVANCSSVDGQAAFRDEECDHRHIDYFQSLEKFHEEGLPDRIPSHLEQKILRDPQLVELDREAQNAVRTQGQPRALNRAKQRYTNLLKKLKLEALRQYQQHWVRERRDWKILTRGEEAAQYKSKTDFVQNICLLIPQRGRLAEQMALNRPLEPEEMWQALQDLHALCVQDFTVLYLPRSRPVDGACPVKCCQVQLDRSVS